MVEMGNNIVSLARVSDSDLATPVLKTLEAVNFKINPKVDNVLIKPNLCYYWDHLTGYTTDPRLVGCIIDVLRENYGLTGANIKIVEADATAMRNSHAFRMLKYDKLAEEKDVTLFNLAEDKLGTHKVRVAGKEMSFDVPESLLHADLFINVPKMKIASTTILTCAMKNIFGCIGAPRKIVYHPILNEAIVGINKILKPDVTVVDGIIALSNVPVRMNLIVTGLDTFSVDWAVSRIMGYGPFWIRYLKIAGKEGLGNPKSVQFEGENWRELRKAFPRVNPFRLKWQNKMQLKLLRLYSTIVGDVIPPFLES